MNLDAETPKPCLVLPLESWLAEFGTWILEVIDYHSHVVFGRGLDLEIALEL